MTKRSKIHRGSKSGDGREQLRIGWKKVKPIRSTTRECSETNFGLSVSVNLQNYSEKFASSRSTIDAAVSADSYVPISRLHFARNAMMFFPAVKKHLLDNARNDRSSRATLESPNTIDDCQILNIAKALMTTTEEEDNADSVEKNVERSRFGIEKTRVLDSFEKFSRTPRKPRWRIWYPTRQSPFLTNWYTTMTDWKKRRDKSSDISETRSEEDYTDITTRRDERESSLMNIYREYFTLLREKYYATNISSNDNDAADTEDFSDDTSTPVNTELFETTARQHSWIRVTRDILRIFKSSCVSMEIYYFATFVYLSDEILHKSICSYLRKINLYLLGCVRNAPRWKELARNVLEKMRNELEEAIGSADTSVTTGAVTTESKTTIADRREGDVTTSGKGTSFRETEASSGTVVDISAPSGSGVGSGSVSSGSSSGVGGGKSESSGKDINARIDSMKKEIDDMKKLIDETTIDSNYDNFVKFISHLLKPRAREILEIDRDISSSTMDTSKMIPNCTELRDFFVSARKCYLITLYEISRECYAFYRDSSILSKACEAVVKSNEQSLNCRARGNYSDNNSLKWSSDIQRRSAIDYIRAQTYSLYEYIRTRELYEEIIRNDDTRYVETRELPEKSKLWETDAASATTLTIAESSVSSYVKDLLRCYRVARNKKSSRSTAPSESGEAGNSSRVSSVDLNRSLLRILITLRNVALEASRSKESLRGANHRRRCVDPNVGIDASSVDDYSIRPKVLIKILKSHAETRFLGRDLEIRKDITDFQFPAINSRDFSRILIACRDTASVKRSKLSSGEVSDESKNFGFSRDDDEKIFRACLASLSASDPNFYKFPETPWNANLSAFRRDVVSEYSPNAKTHEFMELYDVVSSTTTDTLEYFHSRYEEHLLELIENFFRTAERKRSRRAIETWMEKVRAINSIVSDEAGLRRVIPMTQVRDEFEKNYDKLSDLVDEYRAIVSLQENRRSLPATSERSSAPDPESLRKSASLPSMSAYTDDPTTREDIEETKKRLLNDIERLTDVLYEKIDPQTSSVVKRRPT